MDSDLECIYCGKQKSEDNKEDFYDFTCRSCAEKIGKRVTELLKRTPSISNMDKCECGSIEGLSKHITTPTGSVSLTYPMCKACRQELSGGVIQVYNQIQPWHLPFEEQREVCKRMLKEGKQE